MCDANSCYCTAKVLQGAKGCVCQPYIEYEGARSLLALQRDREMPVLAAEIQLHLCKHRMTVYATQE